MYKSLTKYVVLTTIILCQILGLVTAQIPNSLLYQGRLTKFNGDAVVGDTPVIFSIYDALSGGNSLWIDTINVYPDSSGIFTVELADISNSVFESGDKLYLQLEVVGDSPMSPRQLLTSVPYAYASGTVADSSVTHTKITAEAVQSSNILDNTILNSDISDSADIEPGKIAGVAVTQSDTQTISGNKTFTGNVYFGDSTLYLDNSGVRIGDRGHPSFYHPLMIKRNFNTNSTVCGIDVDIYNDNHGDPCGLYINTRNAVASVGNRIGVRVETGETLNINGNSYGIFSYSFGGVNTYALYGYGFYGSGVNYGLYASCGESDADFGAYIYGNLFATGTNTTGAGGFTIDHPLDPENKYLSHSNVDSPDMMNIYNGNIITDADGEAVVELPEYFESLNKDFRYQLTVVGDFAQVIVAEEINNNRFLIHTDKPSIKVSWQVTGIRKDAFAKTDRITVEKSKKENEVGYYLHPEVRGYGIERSINYIQNVKRLNQPDQMNKKNE